MAKEESPVTEAEILAFVRGASWQCVRDTGATIWAADRDAAELAARSEILAMRSRRSCESSRNADIFQQLNAHHHPAGQTERCHHPKCDVEARE